MTAKTIEARKSRNACKGNERVLARWWALVDEGLLRVDSTKGISENYKSLYKAVHNKDCKVVRVKVVAEGEDALKGMVEVEE